MADTQTSSTDVWSFETHPSRYRHWKLSIEGDTARLFMSVRDNEGFKPGYILKLNSYDLGVDIELADAIQRLRFEHPEVKVVIVTSDKDRVFCSGANIHMLAAYAARRLDAPRPRDHRRADRAGAQRRARLRAAGAGQGTRGADRNP